MMLYPFFGRPNLWVWVPVDRDQWVRRIELGLPE